MIYYDGYCTVELSQVSAIGPRRVNSWGNYYRHTYYYLDIFLTTGQKYSVQYPNLRTLADCYNRLFAAITECRPASKHKLIEEWEAERERMQQPSMSILMELWQKIKQCGRAAVVGRHD